MEIIEEQKKENHIILHIASVARQLQVQEHFVQQVFHKLNLEGILSQAVHKVPHDLFRNSSFYDHGGGDSGWGDDIYFIL